MNRKCNRISVANVHDLQKRIPQLEARERGGGGSGDGQRHFLGGHDLEEGAVWRLRMVEVEARLAYRYLYKEW